MKKNELKKITNDFSYWMDLIPKFWKISGNYEKLNSEFDLNIEVSNQKDKKFYWSQDDLVLDLWWCLPWRRCRGQSVLGQRVYGRLRCRFGIYSFLSISTGGNHR